MAGVVHVVNLLESIFTEPLLGFGEVDSGAYGKLQGVSLDGVACRHVLGKCLGIGDDIAQRRVVKPVVEHFGAHNLRRRVDLPVFYRPLVARWKHEHSALAKHA